MSVMVAGKSLHELISQSNYLMEAIAENGGELTPEMETMLEALDLATASKLDGYHFLIENLKHQADFWHAQAMQRDKIAHSCTALAERLKSAIKEGMLKLDKSELEGNAVRAKISATKGSLVIENPALVPDEFRFDTIVTKLDNSAIKAKLEAFGSVPGARIEGGTSIRFYPISAKSLKASSKKSEAKDV